MVAGADVVGGDGDEEAGGITEIANVEGRAATGTWTGGRRVDADNDDDEEAFATSFFTEVNSIDGESEVVAEV